MKKLLFLSLLALSACGPSGPPKYALYTSEYFVGGIIDYDGTPEVFLQRTISGRVFGLGAKYRYDAGVEIPKDILHKEVVVTIKKCIKNCKVNEPLIVSISRKNIF